MNNELKHHGIMGMKWGERRWQNADGSLTPAGKERYQKISSSKILSKRDTKRVYRVEKKRYRKASDLAENYARAAKKFGDNAKKLKVDEPSHSKESADFAKQYQKLAKDWAKKADIASRNMSDIENGSIIAGRDFINQRDHNIIITPWAVFDFMTDTPIYKDTKRQNK